MGKNIRDEFIKQIHEELHSFVILEKSKEIDDVFADCNEIDMKLCIYEVLLENISFLSNSFIEALMENNNILDYLYSEYMKKNGDSYDDICTYLKEVC